MSTMQSEIYDAFLEAGVSEVKSRAAAEVIAMRPASDEIATKLDVANLDAKIEKQALAAKKDIERLEDKIDATAVSLKAGFRSDLYKAVIGMTIVYITTTIGAVGILLKLLGPVA